MICSRCGANIPDNVAFCTNCGHSNSGAPQAPPQPGGYAPGGYAPQGGGYGQSGPQVTDYLIWSIITTLCCCLPLGIVGIIFSINSKNDLSAGRYESAVKNYNIAFYCNVIGLVVGLIANVLVAIIQFAAIAAAEGGF